MNYSVSLEDPFHYALLWIWWGLALIAFGLLVLWLTKMVKAGKFAPITDKIKRFIRDLILGRHRARAVRAMDLIAAEYDAGKIDVREAHQRLSMVIRSFVQEVTGIRTDAYTFMDIQQMGNKHLTQMVALLYVPEFAMNTSADLHKNMELGKELITKWE